MGGVSVTERTTAATARAARTRVLLDGRIAPTLARLALPNVLAMVVQAAMSIAEGYFASRLGVPALAGLALVFPLVMLTQMLSAGSMGGAISSAVARALGANHDARASGLILAAWSLALVLAAASALAMALFGRAVFGLLGGDSDAIRSALDYAAVYFPGCLAIWLCHSSLSVIRGAGNMGVPSLVLLGVSVLSIPLAGAFALGWGPFPALGMAGLALGGIIAHALGAAVAVAYLLAGRAGLSPGRARLAWDMFADILKVGSIASVNSVLTVLTIVLMVGAVGRHGAAALAGYGLGARLEFLMIPIVFGIGAAMTAMVGANIGAGNRRRALAVAWTGSIAAAGIVGGIGAVVAVFPDLWLRLFLSAQETEALSVGRAYFRAVAPFYGFFGLGLALYFASQGAGRLVLPFLGGVIRLAIAFGGSVLLGQTTELGVNAVFIAIAAGMFAYGLFISIALQLSKWE
ncbi:MATE family efflux transporter [Thalassovita sp.]|uniref:MATE family efflux transporter n=1 Tax=Thalassovita sp. TaxID=1979401 RepID=UPI0029DE8AFD|nr:MATE family efflux transporter [Thalassovita sp.]